MLRWWAKHVSSCPALGSDCVSSGSGRPPASALPVHLPLLRVTLLGNNWPPVSTHAFQPLVSLVRLAYFFLACNSCKHFVMSHDICQDVEDRNKTICANSNSRTKSFGNLVRVEIVFKLFLYDIVHGPCGHVCCKSRKVRYP